MLISGSNNLIVCEKNEVDIICAIYFTVYKDEYSIYDLTKLDERQCFFQYSKFRKEWSKYAPEGIIGIVSKTLFPKLKKELSEIDVNIIYLNEDFEDGQKEKEIGEGFMGI